MSTRLFLLELKMMKRDGGVIAAILVLSVLMIFATLHQQHLLQRQNSQVEGVLAAEAP